MEMCFIVAWLTLARIIASLEAAADKILLELEASRDLTQTIVHIDMDSFYASVEVKYLSIHSSLYLTM
jgi:hypothetical protein